MALFSPRYRLTNKIVSALTAVAEAKAVIERARILPQLELKLRRQALIRMTHASTGIEGNELDTSQVAAVYDHQKVNAKERAVHEVKNYLGALKYIGQIVKANQPLTEKVVLKIHKLVTAKTLPPSQCGIYRKGTVQVVRHGTAQGQNKEVVYVGPEDTQVPRLMNDLISWLKKTEKENIDPVITAGIAHKEIAAIHPFTDGNGRTARALATLILYQRGYDLRRLFALEDYYNRDRAKYYRAVDLGKNYAARDTDLTPWLEYFVTGFKEEIDNVKAKILSLAGKKVSDNIEGQVFLHLDQLKILELLESRGVVRVRDVTTALKCPQRTAQFHLHKLKQLKMIEQTGRGPAAAYVLAK
ncbi:MAG: Fic family protein [Patescibacteria group bacterium]